jgi:NAD(P)-dependent dehydrogenase (short-subunit alcohol dehydrogenase family)
MTMGVIPNWVRTANASGIPPAKKPPGPVWLIAEGSSGIGLALAKAVLRQGHRVVLAARNMEAVQDLAAAYPNTAFVAALDGTKSDDIARIIREARDRYGSIDVLVNTAGVGYIPAVGEGDGEGVGRPFDINLVSPAAT